MWKTLLFILPLLLASAVVSAQKKDKEEEKPQKVSIKNSAFDPKTLTIKKGQTVQWTNNDNLDHSIKADDGSFKSGTLKRKQAFEHTFKKVGKYPYACNLHPREKGTIVVND